MIKHLKHLEIDKSKWDVCIKNATFSVIYAYSWYLDIVSPQWDAIIYNNYEAVFPLTCKQKFGVKYLAQPMFAQQLGIFSIFHLSENTINEIIDKIPAYYLHTDIAFNYSNKYIKKFTSTDHTNHLNFFKKYNHIYKNFSKDTKRIIKKSVRQNFEVNNIDISVLNTFYKNHTLSKTPGFKEKDFILLENLVKVVSIHAKTICISISKNNIIQACGLFFIVDSKIIFIHGSSSLEGRKNGAMRFLHNHIIENFFEQENILDFEGSHTPSVNRYYKSFGSEKIEFKILQFSKFKIIDKLLFIKRRWK